MTNNATDPDVIFVDMHVTYDNFNFPFTDEKTQKPIYSLTGTTPKDNKRAIAGRKKGVQVGIKEWGKENALAETPNGIKLKFKFNPIRDGDEGTDSEAFGKFIIKGNNRAFKPVVIGGDNSAMSDDEVRRQLTPGAYVMVKLKLAAYDVNGKGVTGYLQGIKIIKPGPERVSGNNLTDNAADELARESAELLNDYADTDINDNF